MISTTLLVLFYLLMPFLILYGCQKLSFLRRIGAIVIAYGVGIIAGLTGLLPDNSTEIQDTITTITIPLALPLMLFSSDIRSWSRLAGKTVLSLVIALIAVVFVVITGFLLFNTDDVSDLWKVGGLLIGVYTGGTPNLAALKIMLNVDNDSYLITHAYDMIISMVYFFFLITIGQKVFGIILPKFRPGLANKESAIFMDMANKNMWGLFKKENRNSMLYGLFLSIGIFIVSGLTMFLVPQNSQMVVVILMITTLGILASLVPKVNKLKNTFELGMYFILVFSIAVASMVDISQMMAASSTIFYYVFYVIFGSLLLQVLLSSIFKIDTDTVIITSTALICSPPFVPAVAGAIKNKEIIVSGLTVGIIGYAIGNYLGVIIAEFLHTIF
jgi:uncharacterized membrane protein